MTGDLIFASYDFHSDIAANRPVTPVPANGRLYVFVATDTHVMSVWDGTAWCSTGGGGSGTVTTVSVVTANGVSGSVANPTTTPAITLTLGAITPSSVAASGAVSGSNLSGTNTGDQTITLTGDATGSGGGSFAVAVPFAHLPAPLPGGRITLGTGVPVLQSDVINGNTVFYTPYLHNSIMLYNGTNWTQTTFAEVSQILSDATKSPAATVAGGCYDMFCWNDGGTFRCTRGFKWTNTGARGAGAGTAEIIRQDGVWVNRFAITNGPAALRGVYVGTIYTGPFNDIRFMCQTPAAAGGSTSVLYIWNMYNRVDVTSVNIDSTASWAYTIATFREKNGSAGNEIGFVCGLIEDNFTATHCGDASNSTGGGLPAISIGINSATVPGGTCAIIGTGVAGKQASASVEMCQRPALGLNFVSPLEWSQAVGVTTWIGTGATIISSFHFRFRM